MVDRKLGTQLPKGSAVLHESMVRISPVAAAFDMQSVLMGEMRLAHQAMTRPGWDAKRYEDLIAQDKVSYTEAKQVAQLEAAAYVGNNPEISFMSPEYMCGYRFLRTLELTGFHRRGGNTLMIGSGITIPDYLANYLAPPEMGMIKDYFRPEAHLMFTRDLSRVFTAFPERMNPRLLDGVATAVEPDPFYLDHFKKRMPNTSIPEESLVFHPLTLKDFVSKGLMPWDQDLVLMYRADPEVFASKTNPSFGKGKNAPIFTRGDVTQTLAVLKDSLAPDGRLVITAGTGNGKLGLEHRKQLLTEVKVVVQKSPDLKLNDHMPLQFEGRNDPDNPQRNEAVIFLNSHGSIGAVTAVRT